MRLNPQNYPIYFALQNLSTAVLVPAHNDIRKQFKDGDVSTLIIGSNLIMQNAKQYYVCDSFLNALQKATPKIMDNRKHIDELIDDSGVLFLPGKTMITYVINPKKDDKIKLFAALYDCQEQGLIGWCTLKNDNIIVGNIITIETIKVNTKDVVNDFANWVLTFSYFVNHCEIETKILEPKKKDKWRGVKVYNENGKLPITMLDCNWFTELVRTTGFTVGEKDGGFFRWQACGEGMKKRKLIWVPAFEKHGYHRKAKIQ